jgi:hypothetical protein
MIEANNDPSRKIRSRFTASDNESKNKNKGFLFLIDMNRS